MDNVLNQNIPPVLPPPEQKNAQSHIAWLKTLSIGFSLVSFGIAIGIGGYILATQKNQPIEQQQVSVSPTQPSPTPDPTINWKTYTSTSFGYSIKYPLDTEVIKGAQFEFQLKHPDLLVTFLVFGLHGKETIEDYVKNGFCATGGGVIEIEKIGDISVYANKTNDFWKDSFCRESVVRFPNQKGEILNIQGKAYNQDGVAKFNQILSTFQFTN